jgi:hypothetical protein
MGVLRPPHYLQQDKMSYLESRLWILGALEIFQEGKKREEKAAHQSWMRRCICNTANTNGAGSEIGISRNLL